MSRTNLWSPKRDAQLIADWLAGYTTTEISRRLGVVSKNSIIGRAHRLKLPPRVVANQPRVTWTDADVASVKAMLAQGKTRTEIGAVYGIKREATRLLMKRHGFDMPLRVVPPAQRHLPMKAPTLPKLKIQEPVKVVVPRSVAVVAVPQGRVGKCTWLYGDRGNYRACDVPTVPGRSWCPQHAEVCFVKRNDSHEHDSHFMEAA